MERQLATINEFVNYFCSVRIHLSVRVQVRIVYWLGMDDERLVKEVRTFPCLWNVSVKTHRDIKAKENAWKTVLIEVNVLNLESPLVSV